MIPDSMLRRCPVRTQSRGKCNEVLVTYEVSRTGNPKECIDTPDTVYFCPSCSKFFTEGLQEVK